MVMQDVSNVWFVYFMDECHYNETMNYQLQEDCISRRQDRIQSWMGLMSSKDDYK